MDRLTHWYTKVAGVTHPNDDGSDRQTILRRCRPGEQVDLEHEEDNPYDPNAVRVLRENGEQLGYLNAGMARNVVADAMAGFMWAVYVTDLTGGTRGKPTRGANLLVVRAAPGVTPKEVNAYIDGLIPARKPAAMPRRPRAASRGAVRAETVPAQAVVGMLALVTASVLVALLLRSCV